jgi:hydrogenase nickel incorporation protein HypA/HybF
MHELSVCRALLGQVETLAREHRAKGVAKILLHIGPLAGVEPRLLQEAFPFARAGSIADTAELVIETQPIRVRCKRCAAESEAAANRLLCGACGDWQTQLISGDELLLASVEMIK